MIIKLFKNIWSRIRDNKCRYADRCPNYSKNSRVCKKDGGRYYPSYPNFLNLRYAGCYIKMNGKAR